MAGEAGEGSVGEEEGVLVLRQGGVGVPERRVHGALDRGQEGGTYNRGWSSD